MLFAQFVLQKNVRRLPTNCQYAEGSFTKRNAQRYVRLQDVNSSLLNATRTVCSSAVQQRFVSSTSEFVQPNCCLLNATILQQKCVDMAYLTNMTTDWQLNIDNDYEISYMFD